MIEISQTRVRRRDRRWRWLALAVFVAVFLFVFLAQGSRKEESEVQAASLANFDPGYIISDYQMGNYNSMSEAEIQAWLTSKNSCPNTNYNYYLQLSANSNYVWHWENGHFVCLSEELFGDGEVIGSGETAAHIIWQTAQDYHINPQVILVLLQKETGLITDPIPNNGDYRKATGYGCPDTAPCSSQYYGFKNQVRKAAALFRTVLDGGWTNYPLGDNYIQYNPSASCGGSVVNIRSLATSALYRYTPYQPNEGALAAGYGTAYCGAYGNRNFYLYFEDWFGGITASGPLTGDFSDMNIPRILYVKKGSRYIKPDTGEVGLRDFASFEYFTHLNYQNGNLCLSIGDGRNCYLYSDLEEMQISDSEEMSVIRMLVVKNATKYIKFLENKFGEAVQNGSRIIFDKKININGNLCLMAEGVETANECILYSDLEELPKLDFGWMVRPRKLYVGQGTKEIDINTGISYSVSSEKKYFDKVVSWFGETCLRSGDGRCVLYSDLIELALVSYTNMVVPRFLKTTDNFILYDAEIQANVESGQEKKIVFMNKILMTQKGLCLGSVDEEVTPSGTCIMYDDLLEVDNFVSMSVPRYINIIKGAFYYDVDKKSVGTDAVNREVDYFVDKIVVDDKLCLRSREDRQYGRYRCILYNDLNE